MYKGNNIISLVELSRSELQREIKTIESNIEEMTAKLKSIPTKRIFMQKRKTLQKDILEAKTKIKGLKLESQSLIHDAREFIHSRQNGNRVSVFNLKGDPDEQDLVPVVYNTCTACGTVLEKIMDANVAICPQCGVSEPYLESTRNGLAFNEDVEFVNNTYKRQNHFQEWLNQVQARETAPIPDDIIRKISIQLYRTGTTSIQDITRPKIREALKVLRLRRYYENISSILCQLTGVKPRRLLKYEENQLKTMFLVIQKPFERHCPKDRSNFLSYSYILFKFCEITGLKWMLTYFKLLKGNDKLHKQDEVFQKICQDLNWPFTPSI